MSIRSFDGNTPRLGARVYVDEQAAVIGDVELGDDASVWPMCSIRGDVNHIRIGARSNIQDGSVMHVTHAHDALPGGRATVVGADVTVGHNVVLHACTIEDRCLIGMGSVILDGAILRAGVLLGAGSLVTEEKILEGGYLYVGRPAKRVRALTAEEMKWFEYSARHYVRLKDRYLTGD
jgi:carbonic anhydrase/acetyltransferase-like protein (isoleucine patch superfamily)